MSSFWKKARSAAKEHVKRAQTSSAGSSGSTSGGTGRSGTTSSLSGSHSTGSLAGSASPQSRVARTSTLRRSTSAHSADLNLKLPKYQIAGVFGEPDNEKNIQLELSESGSVPKVKAATLYKLIERLTYPSYTDLNLVLAFLLTYRSITTASEIIDILAIRWTCEPKHGDLAKEEFENKVARPVRLRIANLVRTWITKYSNDFRDDPKLVKKLRKFLAETVQPTMASTASNLEKSLNRKLQEQVTTGINLDERKMANAPNPKVPAPKVGSLTLLDMHPLEIARQITLMEFKLYSKAKSWEFLDLRWSKNNGADAPNLLAMVHWSTRMSLWVATEILRGKGAKGKVKVISLFIKVARYLKELGNFNGLMEIMAGFENSAVHRLKPYWEAVPEKHMRIFEQVKEVMEPKKNFAAFRAYLKQVNPPTIPYIGMYFTDLTFMEEGSSNKTKEGLINFSKRTLIAGVISDIQQYQQTPYHLKPVMVIQDYLTHAQVLEEEAMYKISIECLPRGVKNITLKELEQQHAEKGIDSAALAEQEKGQEFDFGELEEVEGYLFYEKDAPHNIELDCVGNELGEQTVSGTLVKLIERLTSLKRPSLAYVETFLMTWHTFCSEEEVLSLLEMRYNVPFPKKQSSAINAKYKKEVQFPIQLRVFNLLKTWLNKYYHDLPHMGNTLALIHSFLMRIHDDNAILKPAVEQILPTLERLQNGEVPAPKMEPGAPPLPLYWEGRNATDLSITEIPPKEIARQLSLVEQELFFSLRPGELLAYVRSKNPEKPKHDRYRGVLKASPDLEEKIGQNILQRETLFYRWVHTEVLAESTVENRALKLEMFVKVAHCCFELRNYNSAYLLMMAVQSEELAQLGATWDVVSRVPSNREIYGELENVYSKMRSRAQFMKEVLGVGGRFDKVLVPPLKLFLDELQQLENSMPDTKELDSEMGAPADASCLIAFKKRQLQVEILADLVRSQQRVYNLKPVEQVRNLLKAMEVKLWDFAEIATRATHLQAEEADLQYASQMREKNAMELSGSGSYMDSLGQSDDDEEEDEERHYQQVQNLQKVIKSLICEDEEVLVALSGAVCQTEQLCANIKESINAVAAGPSDFATKVKSTIAKKFPNVKPKDITLEDEEGEVLGWSTQHVIHVYVFQGKTFLVFWKPFVNRATLSTCIRLKKFIEESKNLNHHPVSLLQGKSLEISVFSSLFEPEAKSLAQRANLHLELVE